MGVCSSGASARSSETSIAAERRLEWLWFGSDDEQRLVQRWSTGGLTKRQRHAEKHLQGG